VYPTLHRDRFVPGLLAHWARGLSLLLMSTSAFAQFVSLDESDWGSMANPVEHNLTSRMPTWTPLALPLDTRGWTQDASMQDVVCDENTFQLVQDRYDAASENTVLLLPNCIEGSRYNQQIWTLNKDGIEFLGQENTTFRIGYQHRIHAHYRQRLLRF